MDIIDFLTSTALEERALQKELEGYTEYTDCVKFGFILELF